MGPSLLSKAHPPTSTAPRPREPGPDLLGSEGERPLWGLCVQSWGVCLLAGSPRAWGEVRAVGALPARQDTPGPRLQWPLLCLFIGGWVGEQLSGLGGTLARPSFRAHLGQGWM